MRNVLAPLNKYNYMKEGLTTAGVGILRVQLGHLLIKARAGSVGTNI